MEGAKQEEMMTFLNVFRKVGGEFEITDDGIVSCVLHKNYTRWVETDVHPGFMTDWQQPLVVALTQATGFLQSMKPCTKTALDSPMR